MLWAPSSRQRTRRSALRRRHDSLHRAPRGADRCRGLSGPVERPAPTRDRGQGDGLTNRRFQRHQRARGSDLDGKLAESPAGVDRDDREPHPSALRSRPRALSSGIQISTAALATRGLTADDFAEMGWNPRKSEGSRPSDERGFDPPPGYPAGDPAGVAGATQPRDLHFSGRLFEQPPKRMF